MNKHHVLTVSSLVIALTVPSLGAFASKRPSLKVQSVYVKAGKVAGTTRKGTKITIKRSGKTLRKLTAKSSKFTTTLKGLKTGQKLTVTATYKKKTKAIKTKVKASPSPVLTITSHKTNSKQLILTGKTTAHTKITVKNANKTVGTRVATGKTYQIKMTSSKLKSANFVMTAKNSITGGTRVKKYQLNYRAPKILGATKKTIAKINYPKGFNVMTGIKGQDSRHRNLKVTATGDFDLSQNGTYTLTYRTIDNNKTKTLKKRTLIVKNVAPKITGNTDVSVKKSAKNFDELKGVTATDSKGKAVQIKVDGKVDMSKTGTYALTYTATDQAGIKSSATRKVTVVNDIKPTITGVADVKVAKSAKTFDSLKGVSATDSDGKTLNVSIDGKVNMDKSGTYSLTYTVKDDAGNVATATRKITVVNDIKPVITGVADVEVGRSAKTFDSLKGVSATDSDGKTLDVSVDGKVNMDKSGTYSLTYTVKDDAGNAATATRKVTVINDIKPTINGVEDTSVKKSAKVFDVQKGVSATDSDGKTIKPTITGKVDMAKTGTYTVTYVVKDGDGNTTTVARKVTVVNDIVPVIDGNLADITVPLNAPEEATRIFNATSFEDLSATDSDGNVLKNDGSQFKVTTDYDDTKSGTYTVTYSATDASGNVAKATRKVIVKRFYATSAVINGADRLQPTETNQYLVTMLPAGSQSDIKWTSSDTKVAKVDDKGTVTGVADGTATITATLEGENGKTITASKKVVVDATIQGYLSAYSSVTINNNSLSVAINFTSQDARPLTVTEVKVDDGSFWAADFTESRLKDSGHSTLVPAGGSFSMGATSRIGWSVADTKVEVHVTATDGTSQVFTTSLPNNPF